MPTPDERARALIAIAPLFPGGPLFVQLKGETETVAFGPYENPSLALGDAVKVRRFLAEVIRKAGGETKRCGFKLAISAAIRPSV
jgi:hypothetical protein